VPTEIVNRAALRLISRFQRLRSFRLVQPGPLAQAITCCAFGAEIRSFAQVFLECSLGFFTLVFLDVVSMNPRVLVGAIASFKENVLVVLPCD